MTQPLHEVRRWNAATAMWEYVVVGEPVGGSAGPWFIVGRRTHRDGSMQWDYLHGRPGTEDEYGRPWGIAWGHDAGEPDYLEELAGVVNIEDVQAIVRDWNRRERRT